ncbi:MAG TPA: hypothetical protein DCL35_05785 [Candidatus Omnitrophica bacterium]|nr:hypothetical protein [Candidatus Omnitrophota bacterium]
MVIMVVLICGFVILLGFEIRHREISERLHILESDSSDYGMEIQKLKEEIKKKKNIIEEYRPPAL